MQNADGHLKQRLEKGEAESVALSVKSHDNKDQKSEVCTSSLVMEAQEANERPIRMQQE